jgi:ankyrin repeat protein
MERGASALARDNGEQTALHFAAFEGNQELVECLLQGSKEQKLSMLTAKDVYGRTPESFASYEAQIDVSRYLRELESLLKEEEYASLTPFDSAIERADVAKTRLLLAQNPTVINQLSSDGIRPLHRAIYFGHEEIVKLLISKGAPLEATTQDGWSALHYGAKRGKLEIVRLLMDAGAKVSTCTHDLQTPLHKACQSGNEDVVSYLIQKKAEIEAEDKMNCRPLHEAAEGGHEAVVRLILRHGADVTARNARSETPHETAAHSGKAAVVEILREHRTLERGRRMYGPSGGLGSFNLKVRSKIVEASYKSRRPSVLWNMAASARKSFTKTSKNPVTKQQQAVLTGSTQARISSQGSSLDSEPSQQPSSLAERIGELKLLGEDLIPAGAPPPYSFEPPATVQMSSQFSEAERTRESSKDLGDSRYGREK